ncbi:MAG: hypothetical protein AB1405_10025 [Bdellovibrionota bacterium]
MAPMGLEKIDLAKRLRVFTDAGLIQEIPTPWQIEQGELEMLLYVISTDATEEAQYKGAPFGHPVLRQPLIFSQVGRDHLRTGSGLENKFSSVCKHLFLTYHQGMPVFDLQLLQTYPEGLSGFRRFLDEMEENRTARARRLNRIAKLILPDPPAYHARFLGEKGWIARAEAFDYPAAEKEASNFPPEFFSLVGLLNYCAKAYPRERRDVPLARRPAHMAKLFTRRLREGRAQGWFARK